MKKKIELKKKEVKMSTIAQAEKLDLFNSMQIEEQKEFNTKIIDIELQKATKFVNVQEDSTEIYRKHIDTMHVNMNRDFRLWQKHMGIVTFLTTIQTFAVIGIALAIIKFLVMKN